jgi:hypothetical protein
MNPTKTMFRLSVILAVVSSLVAGCGGGGAAKIKPKAYNVSITKTTPASVDVELIGITELEKPQWEGYSMTKYWSPGDPLRGNTPDKLSQSLELNKPWKLDRKDPIWDKWLRRGVAYLVIVARLPGKFEDGAADPRRLFISLDKHAWQGKTLEFEVRETQIRPLTPPQ